MNKTPLLTTAEVCDRLGVDRSTVSRWVANGQLVAAHKMPGIRGGYLFTQAAVDQAVQAAEADTQ